MTRIVQLVRALARDPRTSGAGIAAIAGIGWAVAADPRVLAEPGMWAAVVAAVGLLLASDSRGEGPPKPPRLPAQMAGKKGDKVVEIWNRGPLRCGQLRISA